MIALIGLFFYDIFWVFRTSVMVDVATKLAPIAPVLLKIPHTMDLTVERRFAMLGLGDIVIPGLAIALLARFDAVVNKKKKTSGYRYLYWSIFTYTIALIMALVVMLVFEHPQPALLYLSPAGVLTPFLLAWFRGEWSLLYNYTEEAPRQPNKDSAKEK